MAANSKQLNLGFFESISDGFSKFGSAMTQIGNTAEKYGGDNADTIIASFGTAATGTDHWTAVL